MTDEPILPDLSDDLSAVAGEVPGIPGSYSYLRSLIDALPAPLSPDIRSAATGQVNTAEPGTTAAQIASSMTGQAPGSESGASLGVVSELYYANSNLLDNPTMQGMDSAAAVTIGTLAWPSSTYWADSWQARYVLNSGSAPSPLTANFLDSRLQANGFHPFNSAAMYVDWQNPTGASDITVTIFPSDAVQVFYETELPYLTAAFKVWSQGATADANTTKFRVHVELWDANGGGTLLATGPTFDFLAHPGDWNTYRVSVAYALPASISGAYAFQPRLVIEWAKSSAGGFEDLAIGEPVFALSSTQLPPPYSPIVGRWVPSMLRVYNPGEAQPRMALGVGSGGGLEEAETASKPASLRFGAGGVSATDVRLRRGGTNTLRLDNGSTGRAALEMVGGVAPATPAAGEVRLYFDSATKHLFQIDDAGTLTDLAAGGGGGLAGGVPALTLGTANAAGVAATGVRTDATIAAFDATVPPALTTKAGATGSAGFAARRDHGHPAQVSVTDAVSAASDYLAQIKLAADTQYRAQIGLDASDVGQVIFGAGGASAPDTRIFRRGANQLATDDDFYIGTNSSAKWLYFPNGGSILWGSGGSMDTELKRIAADTLGLNAGDTLDLGVDFFGLPKNTTAGTTEARMRQATASDAASGTRVVTHDSQRERDIMNRGWMPYAYPIGAGPSLAFATALSLPINGGSIAIPIVLEGHMLLQSVTFRATAASGTGEFRLYVQRLNNGNAGENTLDEVPNSNGTSAAAGAAANVTSNLASTPLYLGPGTYWLVIRCTSAATAISLGTLAAGTLAANTMQTKTLAAALAATLDFVAATWTKSTAIAGVRLNGRVFGQTAAF